MSNSTRLYDTYQQKMRLIADIKAAGALMQWDQETYLPAKGAGMRGQQISSLSEIAHKLFSEQELGEVLQELMQQELIPAQKRNIELTYEDYVKNKKYTSAFVRALSEQINKTFHAWIEARKQKSFSVFEKDLEALLVLKKEESSILGYSGHPYNAHLNEYEKGCTVDLLDKTFSGLLPDLKSLLDRIAAKPQVNDGFLLQHYPKQNQWDWSMDLIKRLHFDFEAGRQDLSEHPFSTSFNRNDVRITTRVDENDLGNMTWSCIHETGHGLYEQGLPEDQYGLPLGEACSYSIHESQSRLLENNVGRSLHYWKNLYPVLQQYFPQQLGATTLEDFYKGINKVQPSLVRTEADEITYHFHVYIRYELEKKLLDGSLSVKEIPGYWNQQYKSLLNVE
ncbi:MAG: carboxypeptidase M32, partial [Flavisolibacter sp.]